jgi:hypothetical protein
LNTKSPSKIHGVMILTVKQEFTSRATSRTGFITSPLCRETLASQPSCGTRGWKIRPREGQGPDPLTHDNASVSATTILAIGI